MSDIFSSNGSISNKRRIDQIDDTIEYLTNEINNLKDHSHKTEFECSLVTVRMKRQKVDALSMVAKTHLLLADMEVLIAESDLFADIQKLKNKRMKLSHDEVEAPKDVPQKTPAPTTSSITVGSQKVVSQKTPVVTSTTVSVQTDKSSLKKKNKRRHSSSRKAPVDISSDETILVPTISESTASLVETSPTFRTNFSRDLFEKTPSNKSDSEVSLSSSVKDEFYKPYTKSQTQEVVTKSQTPEVVGNSPTQEVVTKSQTPKVVANSQTQEVVTKSPAKKHKSDPKVESKNKSKNVSKRTKSPTVTLKTVADINKSVSTASNSKHQWDSSLRSVSSTRNTKAGDKSSTGCATYVPVRHNMPMLVPRPSVTTMSPILYVSPAMQAGRMQYGSQQAGNTHTFTYYGSQP